LPIVLTDGGQSAHQGCAQSQWTSPFPLAHLSLASRNAWNLWL